MEKPAVVIDCGTGYTKLGYAGGRTPSYTIPTAIASRDEIGADTMRASDGIPDLDFYTGDDALRHSSTYAVNYPIRHGLVENWNNMERLWQRCMFQHLRCDPEEHYFLLTEPPLNPPENREYTAEVMFETYNVPGMYIAVQAVLALAASWTSKKGVQSLTGTVIDSGDGVTHVIPVAEGYVIGSCIRHIPLAGHDITQYIQKMLRERSEPVPPEDSMQVSQLIKEGHCYVCRDLAKEFRKFDAERTRFTKFEGIHTRTKKEYSVDVGYEQFIAPEMFFNPEIYSSEHSTPLPQVVDEAILACPIDTRRSLYGNIVLSGGSTMFKGFEKRLEKEVTSRVDERLEANRQKLGLNTRTELPVNVVGPKNRSSSVWFGGSMLAATPEFYSVCHTKAQYDEEGPRIARHNPVFQAMM